MIFPFAASKWSIWDKKSGICFIVADALEESGPATLERTASATIEGQAPAALNETVVPQRVALLTSLGTKRS